ncbi:MAG: TrmH family RNA methyltransferase [Stackebrandtia sp.]
MTTFQPGTTPLTQRSFRVVDARKLLRRRTRDARRQFLAEGPQAVREALGSGAVVEVFGTQEAFTRHIELAAAAAQADVRVTLVTEGGLASLADTVTPQGIVAVCRHMDAELPESVMLAAVLDGVSDPGNAGTVLRTADAAGADVVVFPDATVDPYNPKCVRASVGSLFHLPVLRGGDTVDHLATLRMAGATVLAADAHGNVDLDDCVDDGTLRGPTAWLFGSEARGLPEDIATSADRRVKVPVYGRAESLNLATAAAVCLYASAREHRKERRSHV